MRSPHLVTTLISVKRCRLTSQACQRSAWSLHLATALAHSRRGCLTWPPLPRITQEHAHASLTSSFSEGLPATRCPRHTCCTNRAA